MMINYYFGDNILAILYIFWRVSQIICGIHTKNMVNLYCVELITNKNYIQRKGN